MAKRNVPPADTVLVEFRESAGLTPPPRTLSNAASRLVDLLDDCLRVLQIGWDIPPDFPADRFEPSVSLGRDQEGPILQYLVDLGFTGDARRLHEAMRRFYDLRDWHLLRPTPGDDKGWKEFQQRYVQPLSYETACLQGVIYDVRQLIIDTGSKGSVNKPKRPRRRRKRKADPQPLTAKQSEAVQVYAEFGGDIPNAARRCGISPKAMRNRLDGAWKKIGKRPMLNATKAKTRRLPTDKRGQEVVFSNDESDDFDE